MFADIPMVCITKHYLIIIVTFLYTTEHEKLVVAEALRNRWQYFLIIISVICYQQLLVPGTMG